MLETNRELERHCKKVQADYELKIQALEQKYAGLQKAVKEAEEKREEALDFYEWVDKSANSQYAKLKEIEEQIAAKKKELTGAEVELKLKKKEIEILEKAKMAAEFVFRELQRG
jgi:hypothetical protein